MPKSIIKRKRPVVQFMCIIARRSSVCVVSVFAHVFSFLSASFFSTTNESNFGRQRMFLAQTENRQDHQWGSSEFSVYFVLQISEIELKVAQSVRDDLNKVRPVK